MTNAPNLLVLDDETDHIEPVLDIAKTIGYRVIGASTVDEALSYCQNGNSFWVAIVDLRIGATDHEFLGGWRFLAKAKLDPDAQVIIFSGNREPEDLIRAPPLKLGVNYSYLRKGLDTPRLIGTLRFQFQRYLARQADGIIYESSKDQLLKEDFPMIAASGLPVLITGPSGCGKEHVAQEIARLALPSSQHRRIETVNCAALTENIALSTLFGYAPGAFTGALAGGSAGILRRISGQSRHGRGPMQETELPGILILDELAELPPIVQAQLLRMMQGQTIHALGDAGTGYQAIVRVIACTNNEAKLMKPFRDDLLGRLDGWHLTVGHPHERRETFVAAARNKIGNFVVTLEPGKPPVKISGLADDVIRTVESKLVPASEGGLRFGFRELEGWVGRACSMALFRAGNDAQLTGAHLLEAWGKRMI